MAPALLFGAKCPGFGRRGHAFVDLPTKRAGPKPCPWFSLLSSAPEGFTVWFLTRLVIETLTILAARHLNIVDVTPTFRLFSLAWGILSLLPRHFDHVRHGADLDEQIVQVVSTDDCQVLDTALGVMPLD